MGLKLAERSLQDFAKQFLFLRGEFFSLRGEIKNVDGLLAFGVNQRDLDVASQPCECRAEFRTASPDGPA